MASHIIQFLWVQLQKDKTVTCLSHCVVVNLTNDELTTVEAVCKWLSERKREITTNIETTAATGGDLTDLGSTLKAVANQYGYPQFIGGNPILAKYGIKTDYEGQ